MERNRFFVQAARRAAGMLVLLLTFGLVLAGCNNDSTGGVELSGSGNGGTLSGGADLSVVSRSGAGGGQSFYIERAAGNSITGMLRDSDGLVYELNGLIDSDTNVFSAQARSSDIVFSLAGVLNPDGSIGADKSHATIHTLSGGEWGLTGHSIAPGHKTVSGTAARTGGTKIPAALQGKWTEPFGTPKQVLIISDNALTWIDVSGPIDLTVVEVNANGSGWDFLVRIPEVETPGGPNITDAILKLYFTQTYAGKVKMAFEAPIATKNILTMKDADESAGTCADAVAGLAPAPELFMTPYTSNDSNVAHDLTSFKPSGFSPVFKTTAAAQAATSITVSNSFTFVFNK